MKPMVLTATINLETFQTMMNDKEFLQSIEDGQFTAPNFDLEGFNGYIAVDVCFTIFDLVKFTERWDEIIKARFRKK